MKNYSNKGKMAVCIELKNNNYGSMLQSYATQVMLNDYGFDYELIQYRKKYTPLFIIKSVPRILNKVVWQDKIAERGKRKFIKTHPTVKKSVEKRREAFQHFRERYFTAPMSIYKGYDMLQKSSRKYNAFFTGSDQLWSPSGLGSNFYNLMFSYPNSYRISYASSFGVKKIPWYQRKRTKAYLSQIQCISCRENSGKEIVKELTNRDVPVVADPTMLYTGEEWEKMLPCERVVKEDYIFSYMLGTSFKAREAVYNLKEQTGLPIVSIHQYVEADQNFGDISVENAGPAEFVDLIRNAAYVCTDSFHGSVFSILNHKKFIVFNRYSESDSASKNTRIESLCTNTGLINRRYQPNKIMEIQKGIDYDIVDKKMEEIRRKSYIYLEKSFDGIPK